ncbi:hypothetical protein [Pseudoalteromonas piscicida]|uniref:hypothetical protein n=1 Tax=Pseudoalteromonas piscicida TaxID=43662 RepID=UPI000E35B144|nr:hypothetical protein [Pseudoalteromonas piscicida]AXQ99174.1 hypothetical protein D0N37_16540 [Pseudoalteromonas piscicida]
MDAKKFSGHGQELVDDFKMKTVIDVVYGLALSQEEVGFLMRELSIYMSQISGSKDQEKQNNRYSMEGNVVAFSACNQRPPMISQIQSVESKGMGLIDFIQSFRGSARVLPGLKGMSIKTSKSKKMIQLRANKNDVYFQLVNYPIDYVFTQNDINTLLAAHKRFEQRIEANIPWKDRNYLLHGQYRKLITWNQLYDFYSEGKSASYKTKLLRFKKRYFSGSWGEKRISTYCRESFIQDYLDRPVAERQPSDRNELIKQVDAAIRQAKGSANIAIDVQTLFNKGDRSRADKSDKTIPEMSTLAQFIIEAYECDCEALGLKLISQFMASTREGNTNKWLWSRVKLDDLYIEVPTPESKTGFRRHPIPKRLVDILCAEKSKQQRDVNVTKDRNNEPLFMFESPYNRGKVNTTLNKQFNDVKASLLAKKKRLGATKEDLKSISSFTQHRIRDLVEQALLDVSASEGQKEKCLGRLPSEQAESYGNLSIEKLSELKDRMVERAELEFPELKALFQRLIDKETEQ